MTNGGGREVGKGRTAFRERDPLNLVGGTSVHNEVREGEDAWIFVRDLEFSG